MFYFSSSNIELGIFNAELQHFASSCISVYTKRYFEHYRCASGYNWTCIIWHIIFYGIRHFNRYKSKVFRDFLRTYNVYRKTVNTRLWNEFLSINQSTFVYNRPLGARTRFFLILFLLSCKMTILDLYHFSQEAQKLSTQIDTELISMEANDVLRTLICMRQNGDPSR